MSCGHSSMCRKEMWTKHFRTNLPTSQFAHKGHRYFEFKAYKMHQSDDQWQCWPYIQSKYGGSYLDTFGRLQKFLTVIVNVRYGFLLVCYSNVVPIRLQKCYDLENRVRGPSRSLKISPFDRAHMTSY